MRSFKQRFIDEVVGLLVRCASDGRSHSVSQALYDALQEILEELDRPRTNWRLVAALTGVKSWINTGANHKGNPFWSKLNGVSDGPYLVMDDLHHKACQKVQRLPSGMTEYTATGVVRHGEVDTSVSPTSPTLQLIAKLRADLEARVATWR